MLAPISMMGGTPVTDPPDPLADIARETRPSATVFSAGTYLDSQRFRVHLGKHFSVDPAEMVLKDERAVIPIGSFHKKLGVTLSLPSVVGRGGIIDVLEPELSDEEQAGLENSAKILKAALERVRDHG